MQYLCIVHTCMHYAALNVTCVLVGMWLYMSSGISQAAAAIAVNRVVRKTTGTFIWWFLFLICLFSVSNQKVSTIPQTEAPYDAGRQSSVDVVVSTAVAQGPSFHQWFPVGIETRKQKTSDEHRCFQDF